MSKKKLLKSIPVLAKTPIVIPAVEEKTFDRIWYNRIAIVAPEIGQAPVLHVFTTHCTADGESVATRPTMQEIEITGDIATAVAQLQRAVEDVS